MKIVIYVDYSNSQFNRDFSLANALLNRGHNVFLVINDYQLDMYRDKYDYLISGYSCSRELEIDNIKLIDLNNENELIDKYSL